MSDAVPRVAVKTHLDGDPKPRADEIADWNAVRVDNGLDEIFCMILLPDPNGEYPDECPLPGYEIHSWVIKECDGKVVCEPTDIQIDII